MVSTEYQGLDSYTQLIRRISKIVYHYIENGEYKTYSIDAADYIDYADLRRRAAAQNQLLDGFINLSDAEQLQLPFLNEGSNTDNS